MPLKVYIYPAGHAGVALYTFKLAGALADQGPHVTLFADDRYELDHLPTNFFRAKVLSSKYEGIREGKGTISRLYGILWAHIFNSTKFYSCVKRDRPDIVHLHSFFFYPVEWTLLKRLKSLDVEVVLTIHNVLPYSWYIRPYPQLDRIILQYVYNTADKLIVHSEANRRQLLETFHVNDEKVRVIPHGEYGLNGLCQEISDEEARRRLDIPPDQRIVLFFGYIRRIKGIDVLLKAFDSVAEAVPNATLVVAGSLIEGQSFEEYRRIISEMKYGHRVRCFIGYVKHKDIPVFFAPADIVVIPYLEFTGQSGVLHVAQGFGKPVVVSDVGGLPEAVADGTTGLVVPSGSAERLSEAIIHLLQHKNRRSEMGERAKEQSVKRFSWNTIARETIQNAYVSSLPNR